MNENGMSPIWHMPMSPEDYELLLEGEIQQLRLNDPQELKKEAEHRREMERDVKKSLLRQNEFVYKQSAKTKTYDIRMYNGEIRMEVINGNNYIVERSILFSCKIDKMYRFKRDYTRENLWQTVLRDRDNTVCSELYPAEYISSVIKLQKTILTKYDCTIAPNQKNIAWKWLRNQLIAMYEQARVIELPYLAGWFEIRDVWHFWTKTEDTELLASEVINKYRREEFTDLTTEEIIGELLENIEITADRTTFGILLLFRMWAYLGNLESDSPPVIGLTLIGANAVEVAKKYLRTMYSEDDGIDIINLDADRISQIREKVKLIRNTPVIFVSCNPDNKSTQNRLADVISWMQSGFMEGAKVQGPFVFCLQEVSSSYPLDKTVVIDVSNVPIFDSFKSFSKTQSLLISIIERGGSYWVEEFRHRYMKFLEEGSNMGENSIVCALKAMIQTVSRILNLNEERDKLLEAILYEGLDEITRQMSFEAGRLLEVFQQGVEKMVITGLISSIEVHENAEKAGNERLYFDNEYYYFHKNLLQKIAENLRLSRKAVLCIKQELSNHNLLKQYRKTTNRRNELEVDITVGNDDKKMRMSVLAIKREFWDKTGGVALFEKGDEKIENDM